MNGTLRICFLLRDDIAGSARRRAEVHACREAKAPGLSFRTGDADAGTASAAGSGAEEPELYVTDSGRICQEMARQGIPAIGYLHDGNRDEVFPGAMYIVENPQEIDADSWMKIYQRLTGRPWTIARTPRLVIREMVPEDLDALYVLYGDPEARRFLDPPQEDRAEEAKILQAYIDKVYGFYGYGMWAVCKRTDGEMIGRAGFAPYEGNGQAPELGYLIRADLRRQGYAAEAVGAVLHFAKESLGFVRVGAHTVKGNAASIALLRKLGFKEVDAAAAGNLLYFGKELDHYGDGTQ